MVPMTVKLSIGPLVLQTPVPVPEKHSANPDVPCKADLYVRRHNCAVEPLAQGTLLLVCLLPPTSTGCVFVPNPQTRISWCSVD